MKNHLKFTAIALSAAILSACSSASSKNDAVAEADSVKIANVKVKTLKKEEISRVLTFSSVLEAYNKVNVAPALQGRIMKINVEVGDYVQKGQLLAQMDENQYIQTKQNFENIKLNYERVKALNDSNNIAKTTYDQMKAQYEVTSTALRNLETNTYLRAPFTGYIASKNYEPGELFGQLPIFELVDITTLKAYIAIPETYFPMVKEGMKLDIKSDIFAGKIFPATIEIVYPTIDQNTHTFTCQVKIPNAGKTLRPGMYVSTDVHLGTEQTIVVPYNAVLKLQGSDERYVFLNNNSKAQRVVVKLGQRFDDEVELISDEIKENNQVVVQGQSKLFDQSPINVTE